MIRRIRELLYDQGFTISGARNKLQENLQVTKGIKTILAGDLIRDESVLMLNESDGSSTILCPNEDLMGQTNLLQYMQLQLLEIRELLTP